MPGAHRSIVERERIAQRERRNQAGENKSLCDCVMCWTPPTTDSNGVSHPRAESVSADTENTFKPGKRQGSAASNPNNNSLPEAETAASTKGPEQTLRSYERQLERFRANISRGPEFPCTSCGCLWFRRSVSEFHGATIAAEFGADFVNKVQQIDETPVYICRTCRTSVARGKIPRLAIVNGFRFPEIPPQLKDLTPLEERLCALRIPFMNIRPLIQRRANLTARYHHCAHSSSINNYQLTFRQLCFPNSSPPRATSCFATHETSRWKFQFPPPQMQPRTELARPSNAQCS